MFDAVDGEHHPPGQQQTGLFVGVVTNGSMLNKIEAVADVLEPEDWVRLEPTCTFESYETTTACTLVWPTSSEITVMSPSGSTTNMEAGMLCCSLCSPAMPT